jgi:hypothetical protein
MFSLRARLSQLKNSVRKLSFQKSAFKPFKLNAQAKNGVFIISAFKNLGVQGENISRTKNKLNSQDLMQDLIGFGVNPSSIERVRGIYGGAPEISYMVLEAFDFQDALFLGKKYRQESIIWGNPNKGFPFAMYYTDGSKKALVAVPVGAGDEMITPSINVRKEDKKDYYTRGKGGVGMSFEFDWDNEYHFGSTPLTFNDLLMPPTKPDTEI